MLIYGNPNMTLKAESILQEKNHRTKLANNTLYEKTCKDYFFIDQETNRFYSAFDTVLIIFIVYACLTSAFYVSYGKPEDNFFLDTMEYVVTAIFTIDIILNFMLLKKNKDGNIIRQHSDIASNYAKGWLILDLIATFPFGLVVNNDRGTVFKLIRLIRLPRILKIFDFSRLRSLLKFCYRNSSRQGKVKSQLLARTYYALITMLLLTFFCSYFGGAIFYFMS
jgi:hypothetical protein